MTGVAGTAALAGLLSRDGLLTPNCAAAPDAPSADGKGGKNAAKPRIGGLPNVPHFAARAKHIIYLFQSGGPSHLDLFDH
ncbi:MAG TPA: DUF1501 domain-containing protein, partial [Solirubrobacterales bacterium]|nr:DUF1501 domain-containing protein [Solirubrobacterales bacterium]